MRSCLGSAPRGPLTQDFYKSKQASTASVPRALLQVVHVEELVLSNLEPLRGDQVQVRLQILTLSAAACCTAAALLLLLLPQW